MREMLAQEARFKEIVSTAMDAIVIFDEDHRISLFNTAAERMFGLTAPKATGERITVLFEGEKTTTQVREFCERAQRAHAEEGRGVIGTQPVASLSGKRASGDTFPAEASISCFEGKDGVQYTLIVRDISERIRQEEELKRQATALEQTTAELQLANEELSSRQQDLERAMTARSRFYASMSHELRTPINAVLGYSTLLLENIYGPLNEKQAEGIQRTQRAAKHLLELVNDVLDLSKIEAGKIDLRLQPVAFPSIIEELFVTVRPLADKYGTKLALESDVGNGVTVVSDPRRVRQILLNLLSNAIKFGGSKPIRVQVAPAPDKGVSVTVIDQGEGIPAEDQERIFQEFVQLGKTQLQEGTGLGLPISRRLAELLHGSLELESQPGKGSAFKLTLPSSADARATKVPDQEMPKRPVDDRRRSGKDTAAAHA
jgi:PAS domain S-box-containing protein